jgi:hypothetical protein
MRKPKTLLVLVGCVLAAAALVPLFTRDGEPRYQGRPLSEWLVIYSQSRTTQNSPGRDEAVQAIRSIGTNGLPYLTKWIRHEPPLWWRPLRKLGLFPARLIQGPGQERAFGAMLAFGILGTNAASAIPELNTMINDTNHPWTSVRALQALGSLGPPAFPHIVAAISNTNQPHRARIVLYLGLTMADAVGTNRCLPPLMAALNDPDPEVRSTARQLLGRFTNAPAQ